MVKQASLVSELSAIVGDDNAARGTQAQAVDGAMPQALVMPKSYVDVCWVLRHANENGRAVIPLGGHRHNGLGNLPARYDIALDTQRLNTVVEFEPADLTITCQAGMTLGALRKTTAAKGLMVPFDPSVPDAATIGGVLAANVSGPARMSLGQPRDFTIGMRVVTADARLTRAGGRVVKNVAGYDLCKLYIGSLGTLAVIVEATFKTIPLPHKQLSLAFDFHDAESACRVVSDAGRAGLNLQGAVVLRDKSGWHLRVDLAGAPTAVARSEFDVAASASDLGGRAALIRDDRGAKHALIARIDVAAARVAELLTQAAAALPEAQIEAQPWDGVCRIGLSESSTATVAGIRQIAGMFQGTCVIERCPAEVKREIDVFGEPPSSFALMQTVKREFDPNGVLSPGRFVGRL